MTKADESIEAANIYETEKAELVAWEAMYVIELAREQDYGLFMTLNHRFFGSMVRRYSTILQARHFGAITA